MQALINFIMTNLRALWPIARVYQWNLGILVRCGRIVRELRPGIHWRWWFIDEVYQETATEITVELKSGSITTRDGRTVGVGANLSYRIVNACRLWGRVFGFRESVKNLALGYLTAACLSRRWQELTDERDDLQAKLLETLRGDVSDWGVEITRLQLTHLVEAPAFQLLGDNVKVA